jgi:hypothetical protein
MLGTDHIRITTLNLLGSSLAPTTYANYDNGKRDFAAFCHEEGIHPLHSITHVMVRYSAWLKLQGTVAATSFKKYCSAVNKVCRDHQQHPIRKRKGDQRRDATDKSIIAISIDANPVATRTVMQRVHCRWHNSPVLMEPSTQRGRQVL